MYTKREIKIYNFGELCDKKLVEELLEGVMQRENLVPIIGSGFSSGLRTRNGIVPTVSELLDEMIEIMCIIEGCDRDEFVIS